MSHVDTIRGRAALAVVQAVAMIEIGALPLWVGVLMGHYGFDPREAGSLISFYLVGVMVSGFTAAPMFGRMNSGKVIAAVGLFIGSIVFYLLTQLTDYSTMAALHVIGGLSIGPVIAVCQGSIGRSNNPHRLFAIVSVASTLIAAVFLGIMPGLVDSFGGVLFFQVVTVIFFIGAVTAVIGFPASASSANDDSLAQTNKEASPAKIPVPILFGFGGLVCLAMVFSMTMSFVERVGMQREYGLAVVSGVLTATAIMKLFPAALAGLLQNKLTVRFVLIAVPIVQASMSVLIFAVPNVVVYAIAAPIFVVQMLFAQVFAFGLISKLEPTGRAAALSPSVLMVGMTIGPILGGSIVKASGYSSLGLVSPIIAIVALVLFNKLTSASKVSKASTKTA